MTHNGSTIYWHHLSIRLQYPCIVYIYVSADFSSVYWHIKTEEGNL